MKISVNRSDDLGLTELGWLHSRHSFSFGDYFDPKRKSFGALTVLNDDLIEAASGFGTHQHDNFEIVTIVLEGAIEHKDSMGNHGIIKANEVQRMSAGTGISHSEFNGSKKDKGHFLQIWIKPREKNVKPSYEQRQFKLPKNKLLRIVSGNKGKDAVYINQDAHFYLGEFDKEIEANYSLNNQKNGAFIFVIKGNLKLDKSILDKGDSAEISGAKEIKFKAGKNSKMLVIEVPIN